MKNPFSLAVFVAAGLLMAGCAGPEHKLGRGISNSMEIARGGELHRSIEQTAIFGTPEQGFTYGLVHGIHRTLGRTALGAFEVLTFPFPPYHPIMTRHFSTDPVYPASYRPGLMEDSIFDLDTAIDFSGGDIAPFVPGSRFKVFDN